MSIQYNEWGKLKNEGRVSTRTTHAGVMLLIGDVDITMNNVDLKFEGNLMVISCDRDRTNVDARQWKNEV